MYQRNLTIPKNSFFLFGPRNTGKTTWLKHSMPPKTVMLSLLEHDLFLELSNNPKNISQYISPQTEWVWLDEVQKVPLLLDEVHRLLETKKLKFALSGSSARKLRRGGANLLAGRALTLKMEGFSARELGNDFNLDRALEWGSLPSIWGAEMEPHEFLSAYVNTYIKEEIREEGLIRTLPPFLRFLLVAGLFNGQVLNNSNLAREAQISRSNIDNYFSILEDTLMGHFLRAYTPGVQVRETAHPKFYWFDQGVARAAAGLHKQELEKSALGIQLETLIFHELRLYIEHLRSEFPIYYYHVPSGGEIDFLIETKRKTLNSVPEVVLIEVKLTQRWDASFEKPIRTLKSSNKIKVKTMLGIYTGTKTLFKDDFLVFPVQEFINKLWEGEIF